MSSVANDDAVPPAPPVSDSRTFARAFDDLQRGLAARQLWLHLGWTDVKQRYRRSLLGPLWITIATGVTAVAMGLLYGTLFGLPIAYFMPYVTLGFIFWNFIRDSILEGSVVFSTNEGLIKQLPAPISVHVYRVVWRQLIIFAHNVVIYIALLLVFQLDVGWAALLVFPAVALFTLNAIWVTIVFGILSTRFRDIGQLLTTLVQLVFFMTPIIWSPAVLSGGNPNGEITGTMRLVELNPMYHFLEISRGPLMGIPIPAYHWLIVIGITVVGWAFALVVLRNFRARVPYWV